MTQPQALPKATDRDSQGDGWRRAGPGFAPHTCTPGRRSRRSRAGPRATELWRGGWFSVPARLRSRTGGRGVGRARAREIRSHNIGYGPSPPLTFRRGGGNRSSSRAWQRFGPRAGQPTGPPLPLAPSAPSGSLRSGQWSCRHCSPRCRSSAGQPAADSRGTRIGQLSALSPRPAPPDAVP